MLEFCPKMEELFVTHDDISLLTHCYKPSASSNPQDLLNLVTSTSHDSEFCHLYNNNINKQKWNNSITDIIYGRLCCCSISVYFLSRMSELASNGYLKVQSVTPFTS